MYEIFFNLQYSPWAGAKKMGIMLRRVKKINIDF